MKHPFEGVTATAVSQRLAMDAGVVTLLVELHFGITRSGSRLLIDDEKVGKVSARLVECETKFRMGGQVRE